MEGLLRRVVVLVVAGAWLAAAPSWAAEAAKATNGPVAASSASATNKLAKIVVTKSKAQATNAAASFLIKPGFRIELVAGEALLTSPMAMAFDENGRLFVAELPGFTGAAEQKPHSGRIRLLEDTDGDGVFDSSTVYADNLTWPSAVACYGGGIFVAAGTEILYLKDNRGDGIADSRKVVFSGFGGTPKTVNGAAMLSGLVWALDNRIHVVTGGLGGTVSAAGAGGAEAVSLAESDFCFDPRTLTLSAEAGSAQSGVTFDDRGRRFVSDFARPLRMEMYELRYAARNPFFARPGAMIDAANPATAVFRWAPPTASRPGATPAQRTAVWPRAATAPTNLLAAGWLTNAHGTVIYRGAAFPPEYLENAFIASPEAGIVHREVLRDNGLLTAGTRASDERATEFLISKDPLFQPMQIINGPEGGLYVADLHHGNEGGRIYRIVPVAFKAPKFAPLNKGSTRDLVAALANANGWQRDTAARLLYERRDPGAAFLLTNMLNNSRLVSARLHAVHVLDGLDALGEGAALRGLRDPDERVREHTVRLCEKLLKSGQVSEALWSALRGLTADPSIRVRYQLAFTLGGANQPDRIQALAEVLARDPGSRWMQAAVLSSLAEGGGDMLATVMADARFRNDAAGRGFPEQLAAMIGVSDRATEQMQVVEFVDQTSLEPEQFLRLLHALGEGLHRTGSSLAAIDRENRLQRFYDQATVASLSVGLEDAVRVAGIRMRGVSPYAPTAPPELFQSWLGTAQSEAVQSAAISTLGRFGDPEIPMKMVDRWQGLSPVLRTEAITVLLERDDRVAAVLTELENGRIGARDLDSTQIEFLRTHHDSAVRERAARVFGAANPQRGAAYERFKPALAANGVAARGPQIFADRCARCHQFGGEGHAFGPELAAARIRGKEELLRAILVPGLEVEPGYVTQVIQTGAGENLVGLVFHESSSTITLRQPNGVEFVLPRTNIQSVQAQPWSMMPEGLEEGLTVEGMADLLDYLMVGR